MVPHIRVSSAILLLTNHSSFAAPIASTSTPSAKSPQPKPQPGLTASSRSPEVFPHQITWDSGSIFLSSSVLQFFSLAVARDKAKQHASNGRVGAVCKAIPSPALLHRRRKSEEKSTSWIGRVGLGRTQLCQPRTFCYFSHWNLSQEESPSGPGPRETPGLHNNTHDPVCLSRQQRPRPSPSPHAP